MTDKLRQAAQQALEALEFEAGGWEYPPPKTAAAITALRAALAEQPAEQEPVADALIRKYIAALVANSPDEAANATKAMVDYVYTAPQPAKRGPLTDDEIAEIVDRHTTDDHGYDIWCDGKGVARAVERAHGIGEQP